MLFKSLKTRFTEVKPGEEKKRTLNLEKMAYLRDFLIQIFFAARYTPASVSNMLSSKSASCVINILDIYNIF
jgi:hypothetical protein